MPEGLPPGEVHLWYQVPEKVAGDALHSCEAVLDETERTYLTGVTHLRRRHEFTVARALLRRTLSRYDGRAPDAWRFVLNEHGRPCFPANPDADPPEHALRFNVSHTAGLIVVAVARDSEVGVDVEDTERRGRTVTLADRWFSPAESAALRALPQAQQRDRFFDLWTLKESYIKARGMGLALPLKHFSFEFTGELTGELTGGRIGFTTDPVLADDARAWRFEVSSPTPRHRAAVALRRGAFTVVTHWP